MNSTSSLLQQLRIDRDDRPAARQRKPAARWLGAAALVAAPRDECRRRVDARQARGPSPDSAHAKVELPCAGSAGGNASTAPVATAALDTSGYVVARRQATVSSKATGRVVEVLIEEGQRVEKGQVIARLDSSGTSAALAEAGARLAQAQADLDAARIAAEDAHPIFRRNEQQHAAALISSQAFDACQGRLQRNRRGPCRQGRGRSTLRAPDCWWRSAITRTRSFAHRSPASLPSRRHSRAKSSLPCPPAVVSRAPASARSSTWTPWKWKST